MRLLILGATGGTGRALVGLARERGHEVTAFVRSPQKLGPLADRVTVRQEIRGALRSSARLFPATMPWYRLSARLGRDGRRSSEPAHAARWKRCRPAVRAG
jgi:nucleoside-diphosphate-sugar epimerase